MSGRSFTSVSFDTNDPVEAGSHSLREQIRKLKRLPLLCPLEDREDAAHNVLVRLLAAAKEHGVDLVTLARSSPGVVERKLEAERSRVRRKRHKLAKRMSEEMASLLPAGLALSELECAELIDRLTEAAGLTENESRFVFLCSLLGETDYDVFADLMGVDKDRLYRIAYKAKAKLEAVLPDVAETLLEVYDHPAQPSPGEGGVWRKFSARVV